MFKTGLEFAPGTTEDCKRLITKMFGPEDIIGAYRVARDTYKTGDLVLVTKDSDPSGFEAMPRVEYVKKLRRAMGSKARMIPNLTLTTNDSPGQISILAQRSGFASYTRT